MSGRAAKAKATAASCLHRVDVFAPGDERTAWGGGCALLCGVFIVVYVAVRMSWLFTYVPSIVTGNALEDGLLVPSCGACAVRPVDLPHVACFFVDKLYRARETTLLVTRVALWDRWSGSRVPQEWAVMYACHTERSPTPFMPVGTMALAVDEGHAFERPPVFLSLPVVHTTPEGDVVPDFAAAHAGVPFVMVSPVLDMYRGFELGVHQGRYRTFDESAIPSVWDDVGHNLGLGGSDSDADASAAALDDTTTIWLFVPTGPRWPLDCPRVVLPLLFPTWQASGGGAGTMPPRANFTGQTCATMAFYLVGHRIESGLFTTEVRADTLGIVTSVCVSAVFLFGRCALAGPACAGAWAARRARGPAGGGDDDDELVVGAEGGGKALDAKAAAGTGVSMTKDMSMSRSTVATTSAVALLNVASDGDGDEPLPSPVPSPVPSPPEQGGGALSMSDEEDEVTQATTGGDGVHPFRVRHGS